MWLSILIVAALVFAVILAILGGGIFSIVLFVIAGLALAYTALARLSAGAPTDEPRSPTGRPMASTGSRAQNTPQDSRHNGEHVSTGPAHPGQEHMTP
jgi:hypothetical protein